MAPVPVLLGREMIVVVEVVAVDGMGLSLVVRLHQAEGLPSRC